MNRDPLQGQKQEQLVGGQFERGYPVPQGRTACLPAEDSHHGAQAITDMLGAAHNQEPLNSAGYRTIPGPCPAEGSEWLHPSIVLVYIPDIHLLAFILFTATSSRTFS